MDLIVLAIVCLVTVIAGGLWLFLLIRKPRVALAILGFVLVALTATIITLRLTYQARLPRFANEVKKIIDPQELQKWAIISLSKSKADSFEIPLSDVPEVLRNMRSEGLAPEMAFYEIGTSPKDSCIQLVWGGGFGHWGIDIGAPSFEKPDDTNSIYLRWIPGVYFWQED